MPPKGSNVCEEIEGEAKGTGTGRDTVLTDRRQLGSVGTSSCSLPRRTDPLREQLQEAASNSLVSKDRTSCLGVVGQDCVPIRRAAATECSEGCVESSRSQDDSGPRGSFVVAGRFRTYTGLRTILVQEQSALGAGVLVVPQPRSLAAAWETPHRDTCVEEAWGSCCRRPMPDGMIPRPGLSVGTPKVCHTGPKVPQISAGHREAVLTLT